MVKLVIRSVFFTLLFISLLASANAQNGWQPLFNGKDFSNFTKLNGEAEYHIEGDAIVGTSKMGTPNTFLATKKTYGDFILELEVKVDTRLNSGIQIRSLSTADYRNGRVHGYQVEIDPSNRKWAGGLYDEARRGWLYPLTRNPKGQEAFQNGTWNKYRIEAIGNSIRTWINGVQCTNLVDDMTTEGFIALQVHAINNKEQEGTTVSWRNIRIKTDNLKAESWPSDPDVPEISYLNNQLTENEKRHGWRLLWDGKTSNGWRGAKSETFPTTGWEIKDGILTIHGKGGGEARGPGDIITNDLFSEFELQVDFMLTEGANSGIKYFVDPELNKGQGSAIGLEFQVLHDEKHPDAKAGEGGNRTVGSLYDLIPATNLSEPDRNAKRVNGPGQWNRARIVVRGNHVEHWLNDIKVVEYERGSQIYRALVQKSKYKEWPNFGEAPAGHILLQEHGDTVHYRNIKIREF